jgi:hypothetical protein
VDRHRGGAGDLGGGAPGGGEQVGGGHHAEGADVQAEPVQGARGGGDVEGVAVPAAAQRGVDLHGGQQDRPGPRCGVGAAAAQEVSAPRWIAARTRGRWSVASWSPRSRRVRTRTAASVRIRSKVVNSAALPSATAVAWWWCLVTVIGSLAFWRARRAGLPVLGWRCRSCRDAVTIAVRLAG